MKQIKEISVIIASYNPKVEILGQLLNSLLKQTHSIHEIIIVDDGSDKPIQFVEERVKIIRLSENFGPAYARNIGVNNVKTEYTAFIDSDCIPKQNWIELLFNKFDTNLYSGISGPYGNVPKDHTLLMKLENTFFKSLQLSREQTYNYATTANWITKTDYIRKAGLFKVYQSGITRFNNYFNEDGELATSIISLTNKPILWSPSVTVEHHISERLSTLVKKQAQLVRGILLSNSQKGSKDSSFPTLRKKILATLPLISYVLLFVSGASFIYTFIILTVLTNISFHKSNLKVLPASIMFHALIIHLWVVVGLSTVTEILLIRYIFKIDPVYKKD